MKLGQFRKLYKNMKKKNIDRIQFEYVFRGVLFDIFFFVDENPFKLIIGSLEKNLSLELAITAQFQLSINLNPKEQEALCHAVGFKPNPFSRFKGSDFFEQLNLEIPPFNKEIRIANPHDIAKYLHTLEEKHKTYFRGWVHHNIRPCNVKNTNLHKTKTLLGTKAFEHCRAKNIRSCWTDNPDKANEFELPTWHSYG